MTRQEASDLYGWLRDSYPRNYKDADERRIATTIENLARTFGSFTYKQVREEYERVFTYQKNEPHPSEIRRALKAEGNDRAKDVDPDDIYRKLKQHPQYAEMERAYGVRACRKAAKCCIETGTIQELTFRLQRDIPCTEKDYSAEIAKWKRGRQA